MHLGTVTSTMGIVAFSLSGVVTLRNMLDTIRGSLVVMVFPRPARKRWRVAGGSSIFDDSVAAMLWGIVRWRPAIYCPERLAAIDFATTRRRMRSLRLLCGDKERVNSGNIVDQLYLWKIVRRFIIGWLPVLLASTLQ